MYMIAVIGQKLFENWKYIGVLAFLGARKAFVFNDIRVVVVS